MLGVGMVIAVLQRYGVGQRPQDGAGQCGELDDGEHGVAVACHGPGELLDAEGHGGGRRHGDAASGEEAFGQVGEQIVAVFLFVDGVNDNAGVEKENGH